MLKICPINAPGMTKICPIYALHRPKICPRYSQDMPKILPRYAKDRLAASLILSPLKINSASTVRSSMFTVHCPLSNVY